MMQTTQSRKRGIGRRLMDAFSISGGGFGSKLSQAYSAASVTITRIKNWLPDGRDANGPIFSDGTMLRNRSRSLLRENAHAAGAINLFVVNCVGTGITPTFKHKDPVIRKKLNAAWNRWSRESDADGRLDFYGLQALVCRAWRSDGETFVRKRFRRKSDNFHVPFQLQVLEADFVPYSKQGSDDVSYTRGGIVFNLLGQREAYWMYRDHPGSDFNRDPGLYQIPADQVMHVYSLNRPGQLRGEPYLTPAIVMLYDLKQYLDAKLTRAKLANLLSLFIKKGPLGKPVLGEDQPGEGQKTDTLAPYEAIKGLTPGGVNYLNEGEEVQFMTPAGDGVGLNEFLRSMIQAVARALNLSEWQLSGDLSQINLSSIRAGLLEFRRWIQMLQQQVMIHQFCRPVMADWLEQAALANVIDAQDFTANREEYENIRWQPQGWTWIDPLKDVQAAKDSVRSGFKSRTMVAAELGLDASEVDSEQQDDNERSDKADLLYDSDGRNPDKGQQRTQVEGAFDPEETGVQRLPAPVPVPEKTSGAVN